MDDRKYKDRFYMQKESANPEVPEAVVDLELNFKGMYIKQITGLSDKGNPKNIYFEKYAESDKLRSYAPKDVKLDATEISIVAVFLGDNCRDVFDSFFEYVRNGRIDYWDNIRKRKTRMMLSGEVKLSDDNLKGSDKYIIASFPFQNLYGKTEKVVDIEE